MYISHHYQNNHIVLHHHVYHKFHAHCYTQNNHDYYILDISFLSRNLHYYANLYVRFYIYKECWSGLQRACVV